MPDAAGYPYSVTQYTADNTGRIKIQGGVGYAFQPGKTDPSKTTRYFYSKPYQWELDRLFGNDVGFAEHYLKNMVIDPNGQVSISYLNASGKTIATALSGPSPADLDDVSPPGALHTENIDLLTSGQFKFNASSLTLSASTTYTASVIGSATFNYSVEKLISRYPGPVFMPCSNCFYELTIRVRDDCNSDVYSTALPVQIGSKTADCNAGGTQTGTFNVNLTRIGEYYVTFEFVMSPKVIEDFTDSFIKNGQTAGAVTTEFGFINRYLRGFDFTSCFTDCRNALQQLGTQTAFTSMFKLKLKELGTDTTIIDGAAFGAYTDSLYAQLYTHCNALQQGCNLSPCDLYKVPMREDVSPGGQYATINSANVLVEPATNVLITNFRAVFPVRASTDADYIANAITLESGTVSSPNDVNFTLNDLVTYWRPEWADLFLVYHPEACKLAFCNLNFSSNNWDEKIRQIYTKAADIGLIASGLQYSNTNSHWLLDADPFFTSGGLGVSRYAAMKNDLDNYSSAVLHVPSGPVVKGLSKFVDYQLYCADTTSTTNQYTLNSGTWDNCTPVEACRVPDREWELYSAAYLELKRKYYEELQTAHCGGTVCPVGVPYSLVPPTTEGPPLEVSRMAMQSSPELMLGETGEELSDSQYLVTNYAVGKSIAYVLVKGKKDAEPEVNKLVPQGYTYASRYFYDTLAVVLPSGTIKKFNSVWSVRSTRAGVGEAMHLYATAEAGPEGSFYAFDGKLRQQYEVSKSAAAAAKKGLPLASHTVHKQLTVHTGTSSHTFDDAFLSRYAAGGSDEAAKKVAVEKVPQNSTAIQQVLDAFTPKLSKNKLKADSLLKAKGNDEMVLADYSNGNIYLVNKTSGKSKPALTGQFKKSGFGEYEYKEYVAVRLAHNSWNVVKDAWIARHMPGQEDGGGMVALVVPPVEGPMIISGPCEPASDFELTQLPADVAGTFKYSIHLKTGKTPCPGQSSPATLYVQYSGGGGIVQYVFQIVNGAEWTGEFTLTAEQAENAESIYVCGVANCTVDPCIAYRTKISRFPSVSELDPEIVPSQYNAGLTDSLTVMVQTSCESQADDWMRRLAPGLSTYPQAKIDELRAKLIQLCVAGGDWSHPLGASTLPGTVTPPNGYTSFGAVIIGVLNLPNAKYTAELNPWLIESPAPYGPKQHMADVVISNSNPEICQLLDALRTASGAGTNNTTFHSWLQTNYGTAYTLTQAELNALATSCGNCKYLLSADIKLPTFLVPGAKGCATRAEYTTAMAGLSGMFTGGLTSSSPNYETIVSNYLNQLWGFSFSFDRYTEFAGNTQVKLCNEPPYTSVAPDNYACIKSQLALAVSNGKSEYAVYITEQKRKFREAYISTCSAAKAAVGLTVQEKIYHYTLYYYDQADNLVRTVPPEGVAFLSSTEMQWVANARNGEAGDCATTYNGPTADANVTTAKQAISNHLINTGTNSIELWAYQYSTSKQVIVTTPDFKYMVNACINGNLVNVDIYTLIQDDASSIRMTLSNHITADISSQLPLGAWTHLVVQGTSMASGTLQLYVNGQLFSPVSGAPSAGCGWEITSNPLAMPNNTSALKHLRLYNRLMTAGEITANASSPCFAASNVSGMEWYRFNTPAAGSETTIAAGSTVESSLAPYYPAHRLPTTYAYNSTNQVSKQYTPDGGTSLFWYDPLSRLTISRNAKQAAAGTYSYTQYDNLGRITEVGQKATTGPTAPGFISTLYKTNFLAGGTNSQITQTLYDEQPSSGSGVLTGLAQKNLRKRVAASIYRDNAASTAINASYYSYDLAGNVKTLWQQVSGLGVKQLDYEYDLASGKVNFVAYQHGSGNKDRFYYEYKYDAENRLTDAWSGVTATVIPYGRHSYLDLATRKRDAHYRYYLHGPLARMELGDQGALVQGVDYAYTLQGWLKGVNGNKLSPADDMGRDGNTGSTVARDVVAYSLGYYTGDYAPVGITGNAATTTAYPFTWQPSGTTGQNLYNGNISSSTLAVSGLDGSAPVGYTYHYDQLNRLKTFRQHSMANVTGAWNSTTATNKYLETFTYDGNGNIQSAQRYDQNGALMDNLAYNYNRDGSGQLTNNRLRHVSDAVGTTSFTGDLETQNTDNYTYDPIGNLTADAAEGIAAIDWSVYGKIRSIDKTTGSDIAYTYDPSGNRVSKTAGTLTTHYVRDAQGNTLAVYETQSGVTTWKEQQLYGSSRLGMWKPNVNIATTEGSTVWGNSGNKFFELSNHLGNVLAVITDNRTQNGSVYEPVVVNAQDTYAFGMMQPGRTFTAGGASAYRYGFNGKENDNEVKGDGNQQDYGMRIYDPRVGRFLSTDPIAMEYPDLTPYQFASNTPIVAIDLDGLEGFIATGVGGHGMVISAEDGAKIAKKISNTVSALHQKGMQNVAMAEYAKQLAIKQGRVNGDGITWKTKAALYIAPWWNSGAPYSDANDGAVLLRGRNLDGSKATKTDYVTAGVAIFITGISGKALKEGGEALIEGTIKVFKNGEELSETAYKFGKYGHRGTKQYNSIVKAVKGGGNFVASSMDEALSFLKEALPGIKNESGDVASKFGYRIDEFTESADKGLKQGHQGTHINYYDKANKVKGTILIDN